MITSVQQFIELNDSDSPELRRLGRTLGATDEVWNELLRNHLEYWEAVVLNKSIPIAILDRLAECGNDKVRDLVAMKRKLSLYAMRLLATDADPGVRLTLVRNPKIDIEVLREMLSDEDEYIAGIASQRLSHFEAEG
ncbi:MAG: hypothetical protein H6818_07655 [Phycisphaerales bacterium]|nr:hypothetical protein [Phycisphaerales bacterium]MCB9864200.1 hypothetical protein [Phycisphaerales bacterium]